LSESILLSVIILVSGSISERDNEGKVTGASIDDRDDQVIKEGKS
jgi:hypothetical protein